MKRNLFNSIMFTGIAAVICIISFAGCSSRLDPVTNENGAVLFSPKDSSDIDAEVLLYKGTDDAGRLLTSDIYTIGDRSKVYAAVKLLHREYNPGRDIMVHIDWIDPDGNSFFMKREDIANDDTVSEIKSAISIPADKRDPGIYKLRVYLYRELAVEKNFSLVDYNADSAAVFAENDAYPVKALIKLGSTYDRNNTIPKDTGTVFEISSKAKVFAGIAFENKEHYKGKEFSGEIRWCGEDGNPFYTKSFTVSPFDNFSGLTSAISANKSSREPGIYKLRIYLYNRLVGEKTFRLIPETKEELKVTNVKGIDAGIIFCSKVGKKSGKPYGISDNFAIKKKGRVHSLVTLADTRVKPGKSTIKIEWVSPDNESFYSKTYKISGKKKSTVLDNSISVTKEREPGTYKCRVYLDKLLIAEKSFRLSS